MQFEQRAAGVIMPVSSLAGKYGIGDFGPEAYRFVNFLKDAGFTYWQILPFTKMDKCPFQSSSSIAGDDRYIDLEALTQMGLINPKTLKQYESMSARVDYDKVKMIHTDLLWKAFQNATQEILRKVWRFAEDNAYWLDDYALYMSIKESNNLPIQCWEEELQKRDPHTLNWYRECFKERILFHKFLQYLFFMQWSRLKKYANENGIRIIGDIPIYPAEDSVDFWVGANKGLFNAEGMALKLKAGVPPDDFNSEGQLWGNPTYNWQMIEKNNFEYWIERFKMPNLFWAPDMKMTFDVNKIDHAIGLVNYWGIPVESKKAKVGKWYPGPRDNIFKALEGAFGDLSCILEDLGIVTDQVREFINGLGYPRMAVLQFGFYRDPKNPNFKGNVGKNVVFYTGTHDNMTIVSAVKNEIKEHGNQVLYELGLNPNVENDNEAIAKAAINYVLDSRATIAIIPFGDLLGLEDEAARINEPGTIDDTKNWVCRAKAGVFTPEMAAYYRRCLKKYGRMRK